MITFRIVTNHGTVDFANSYTVAARKYKQYCLDCVRGYSDFVRLMGVNSDGSETELASFRK